MSCPEGKSIYVHFNLLTSTNKYQSYERKYLVCCSLFITVLSTIVNSAIFDSSYHCNTSPELSTAYKTTTEVRIKAITSFFPWVVFGASLLEVRLHGISKAVTKKSLHSSAAYTRHKKILLQLDIYCYLFRNYIKQIQIWASRINNNIY